MGLVLPPPSAPKGSYVPVVRMGNTLYTAGHLPIKADGTMAVGKVGEDISGHQHGTL